MQGHELTRRIPTFLIAAVLCLAPLEAANVPRPSPEYAIQLSKKKQLLLSQYRGKVVVLMFFLTTCPHCQLMAQFIERLNKEYGPRGFQPLAVAFNPNADVLVPDFIKTFGVTFPVGYDQRAPVYAYLEHSPSQRMLVPILVFIDRQRVIRGQYFGGDPFLGEPVKQKNIRGMIVRLMAER